MRAAALIVLMLALATAPTALADDIVVLSTIQAAVNAAEPGDTVVVPPGRYRESVTISESGITIRGSRGAVLDASGFSTGIRAASGPGGPVLSSAHAARPGRRGAPHRGRELHGRVLPRRRRLRDPRRRVRRQSPVRGLPRLLTGRPIEGNHVTGTDDGAIYVGSSHDVLIERNHATDSTAGILVENSTDVVVRRNTAIGNTGGIVTFVLPGLAVPVTEDVLIEGNVVMHNNRPNPLAPSLQNPLSLLPTGTGILTIGADRVMVRENRVVGNDTGGIGVVALPIPNPDPRVDPEPDGVEVRYNVALRNGLAPDSLRSPLPGADVIYDGSGSGNCFAGNVFGTEFLPGITTTFACG